MARAARESAGFKKARGELIKRAREAAGLTQVDLEKATGIAQPHISAIERGDKGISLEGLVLLAKVIGTTVDALTPTAVAPKVSGAAIPKESEKVPAASDRDRTLPRRQLPAELEAFLDANPDLDRRLPEPLLWVLFRHRRIKGEWRWSLVGTEYRLSEWRPKDEHFYLQSAESYRRILGLPGPPLVEWESGEEGEHPPRKSRR